MSADLVYSVTLFLALADAAGAIALTLIRRGPAAALIITGFLLGIISFGVHVVLGHGSASPEPMDLATFLMHHKAYFALAGLLALALLLHWRARAT